MIIFQSAYWEILKTQYLHHTKIRIPIRLSIYTKTIFKKENVSALLCILICGNMIIFLLAHRAVLKIRI